MQEIFVKYYQCNFIIWGRRWRSMSRHCATNRKVAD